MREREGHTAFFGSQFNVKGWRLLHRGIHVIRCFKLFLIIIGFSIWKKKVSAV
jgi:hypothetical protein